MSDLELVVTRVDDSVPGVRSLDLATPDGARLPRFVPGSHLVVHLGEEGDRTNAYSLTSDGTDPTAYSISVLRVADGAGGSRWVHDALAVGDRVRARLPRSAFAPVARARKHLLVAGGIGVTPIVSHLRAAARWGREVQVLYAFREGHGAHVDDVLDLCPSAELLVDGPDELLARLRVALREQPVGTHLYVCGPGAMIDAVLAAAADAGWPGSRVHLERFGTDALDPGDPFTVTLARTGRTLRVPSGTSLLEALEADGVAVPNLCRQGVCGECMLPVVSGRPLHRDLFLSEPDKASGRVVMPCVSRADGPSLEVAL
ncbi:PDR/VanB family oxidoreductase [Nocardioides flavescens]|uniref:2Fe-2S iron-sulfur cluster binding domain-containing protein n=1 Tax=Nocardioides flavescens TaxID=2691959 RepID=A0A6L7EXZ7_9ACTN|nr:PDR/VanB family oxidoreductase [Nocardioides flavescens]MXG89215.1 2Fe-2S iron-sulfur cluster binding domain-containing protein [Nocardioides flavescens]